VSAPAEGLPITRSIGIRRLAAGGKAADDCSGNKPQQFENMLPDWFIVLVGICHFIHIATPDRDVRGKVLCMTLAQRHTRIR
jgi:hypothetical protein